MKPRVVEYYGTSRQFVGQVAYVRLGDTVYFTGLMGPDKATSTINAAEDVIRAISAAEQCSWQQLTFYDVETHRGYYKRPTGSYIINRLEVESGQKGRPMVQYWHPVAMTADMLGRNAVRDLSELPGVPEEVLQAFSPYIN